MSEKYLYDAIAEEFGRRFIAGIEIPSAVTQNLNPNFPLRPYQVEALQRFLCYVENDFPFKRRPSQLLFHMATGSGKTLIMAAAILYLYQRGYRNFIFFVHLDNIIQKTRDNFLNPQSPKYLFAPELKLDGQRVALHPVDNFQAVNGQGINILFTTIQGLHMALNTPRENAVTYNDFAGRPIVLISDEAHHLNALTKQKLSPTETKDINTWEATVSRIFQAHPDNLLLEFTATVEVSHPAIAAKYRDKILYDYSLKQYREDGYSKEVMTLEADLPQMDRALQAIVVSQYRKKVAERHRIPLKPVVLMKANYVNRPTKPDPNKVVSGDFRAAFHERLRTLTAADLAAIRDRSQSTNSKRKTVVQRAFDFFAQHDISLENLIRELQSDFAEEKALSVDSQADSETYQIAVNTLEAPDNAIRVVFAVEMLNEGWDVLNLFDIVRLYNTRDAKENIPGPTTIKEAQLIGRGARYYPFQLDPAQPRFQRKFDEDLDNDLRVLEELHYHSANNPRYIQELRTALIDIGMMPERPTRELCLNIKDSFKQSTFWQQGNLFTNEAVPNDNADVFSVQDTLIVPRYTYSLRTGYAADTVILDEPGLPAMGKTHTAPLALRDFDVNLLRAALAKIPFYQFERLQRYFPHLLSISAFITADAYLGQVTVDVTGTPAQLQALTPQMKMEIALDVLRHLADDIQRGTPTFRGTYEFKPQAISHVVKDKVINREYIPSADVGTGMHETTNVALHADLSQADWYVYDENYGTSEEKALVKYIQSQIPALRQRYKDIYLLRNEKLFQLYRFADGRPYEPDFVLFLTDRATGRALSYQLFIEPKGEHLISTDQWKEDFLLQIEAQHEIYVTFPNTDFELVGLPFYNEQVKKQAFEAAFKRVLL